MQFLVLCNAKVPPPPGGFGKMALLLDLSSVFPAGDIEADEPGDPWQVGPCCMPYLIPKVVAVGSGIQSSMTNVCRWVRLLVLLLLKACWT